MTYALESDFVLTSINFFSQEASTHLIEKFSIYYSNIQNEIDNSTTQGN